MTASCASRARNTRLPVAARINNPTRSVELSSGLYGGSGSRRTFSGTRAGARLQMESGLVLDHHMHTGRIALHDLAQKAGAGFLADHGQEVDVRFVPSFDF